jgi:hypothetical protein
LICQEEIKTVHSEGDQEEAKEQDKEGRDCIVATRDQVQDPVAIVCALLVANESHTSPEFPVHRQYAPNADGP